jgi:hypothetical protein
MTTIRKETDVAHFKVLFQHLPGETRNPDRNRNSGPELGKRSRSVEGPAGPSGHVIQEITAIHIPKYIVVGNDNCDYFRHCM